MSEDSKINLSSQYIRLQREFEEIKKTDKLNPNGNYFFELYQFMELIYQKYQEQKTHNINLISLIEKELDKSTSDVLNVSNPITKPVTKPLNPHQFTPETENQLLREINDNLRTNNKELQSKLDQLINDLTTLRNDIEMQFKHNMNNQEAQTLVKYIKDEVDASLSEYSECWSDYMNQLSSNRNRGNFIHKLHEIFWHVLDRIYNMFIIKF
jgi:gas vesicle protein